MRKPSAQEEAAYQRAKQILRDCYKQGRDGAPEMYGDPKMAFELIEESNKKFMGKGNIYMKAFRIGKKRYERLKA